MAKKNYKLNMAVISYLYSRCVPRCLLSGEWGSRDGHLGSAVRSNRAVRSNCYPSPLGDLMQMSSLIVLMQGLAPQDLASTRL